MNSFLPTLRFFSSDRNIWHDVFFRNEYGIPLLSASDVVIDIGAHTGAFVCACLARGGRRVVAFEPDSESFQLAVRNVQEFQSCHKLAASVDLQNVAVWRSDRMELLRLTQTRFSELTNSPHQAAQCTLFSDKDTFPVSSVGLDRILEQFPEVTLLKMDCEGAEWPVLFTANLLGKVKRLVLEVHSLAWKAHESGRRLPSELLEEFGSTTFDQLKARLETFGLECTGERIQWRFHNNPDFYFGVAVFNRGDQQGGPKDSLNSRVEWEMGGGGEVTITASRVPRSKNLEPIARQNPWTTRCHA